MSIVTRSLLLTVAAATLAACNADGIVGPGGHLPFAVSTRSCGPADGPAVHIVLSATPIDGITPGDPNLTISVWRDRTQLPGAWTIGGSDGYASYSAGKAMPRVATGTLTVDAASVDGTVDGTVDLVVDGGGKVAGRFKAPWVEMLMLCG